MRDAVIVDAVRSPIGKRNGALSAIHPVDLSAQVLRALAARTELDPGHVDDVVWGCVSQVGEQSSGIGRYSVLAAGWPEHVPGLTVDRQCGSSQQAVSQVVAGIISGQYDIAVAGGVESMSRIPLGASKGDGTLGQPYGTLVRSRYNDYPFNQGIGAELIADKYGFSRTQLDQHAADSHARASQAVDTGNFDNEIAPVVTSAGDGESVVQDQGIRRGTTVDSLANLSSPFIEGGKITAGNASQISDGCAAMLLTSSDIARERGWSPLARVHTAVVVGADPITMLEGPIPATAKALSKSGLTIDDIEVFEVNEAFASVTLAWLQATHADYAAVNPNGGAIALGHPLGGSGVRLMTTMVHHMQRNNFRYGLQVMCEGGGMANATILELL